MLGRGYSFIRSASIWEHPGRAGTDRGSQGKGDADPALQKSRRERRRQAIPVKDRWCQLVQEHRVLWVLRGRRTLLGGDPGAPQAGTRVAVGEAAREARGQCGEP